MAGKGVQLGFLKYVLGFDSLSFKKGISDADADLVKLQKRFAAKGKEFQTLGKKMTALVTLPFAGLAAAGIKEAQETAAAMAQVNASLASMGNGAGRSAAQLEKIAGALETKSLFEADQILKDVTATMLTFGDVTGRTFDRAQQAAVDLATKFGKDLSSSAVMVGKALQDPVKGLTALSRVGVSFSAAEKEQIKTMVEHGNVAKAQELILASLERQVKGSAAAAQDADPWNKLSDSFKSIAESVGTLLLPIIPPLANALASVAQWLSSLDPTTQKWVVGIGAAVAALGPFLIVLGNVITAVGSMGPLVLGLVKGWGLLTTALTALGPVIGVVRVALLGLLGNPVFLGAAVVIGGIYLAFKHWNEIQPIVQSMVSSVAGLLRGAFASALDNAKARIGELADKFRELRDKVVTHSYVPEMVDGIAQQMQRLDAVMVAPAKAATSKTQDAFKELQQSTAGLLNRLFPEEAGRNQAVDDIHALNAALEKGIINANTYWQAVHRALGEDAGPTSINADPLAQLESSFDMFNAANDDIVVTAKKTGAEIAQAYGDMATDVIGSMKGLVSQLKSGDILGALESVLSIVKEVVGTLINVGVIHTGTPGGATPRAHGGPVVPGRNYLVGENGPEYVRFGQRGYVTPPKGGGQTRVQIVPSKYFDAVVDNRAAGVAAPMAGRAAIAGAAGGASSIYRRAARTLP